MCSLQDASHLTAVARDFCPFPNYNPSPLLKMLSANSSQLLSEHYAAVQASLTPQQQQDFTQSLRSTFGREGRVSHGGVGIVALSLAVLFDTVAREVKGECVSNQEPIPGLFLKDPTGTYSPPVLPISKYLRLVPHIANNPTRMRDETEKYLLELKHIITAAADSIFTGKQLEATAVVNLLNCYLTGESMVFHLMRITNKTIDPEEYIPIKNKRKDPEAVFNLNCDPEVASERFLTQLDSLGDRTKEAFEICALSRDNTVITEIVRLEMFMTTIPLVLIQVENDFRPAPLSDFDLKANALGKWV